MSSPYTREAHQHLGAYQRLMSWIFRSRPRVQVHPDWEKEERRQPEKLGTVARQLGEIR